MSLQQQANVNNTATAFSALWTNWTQPPASANARKLARETRITNIVTGFNFIAPPVVSFENMEPGLLGGFNWTDWSLKINDDFTSDDDITFANFMELCRTVYHETRHCEQVYRCAQGLGAFRPTTPPPAASLKPPDMTIQEMIQFASESGGGVASKIAAFSGNPLNQQAARVKLINKVLNVPTAQATTADTNSGLFAGFIALPKPAWFKRRTVLLEVEEWMRSIAKTTLFGMTMFVEEKGTTTAEMNKMYKDLPVELDAHKIEDSVAAQTELLIGHTVAADGAQPRTNAALFGP
ncbi:MAG TPA: hypothetical protein VLY04_19105 [Bryobacteraceae bacterium]|nr:hypothetical protein [Bryobacteraceae bacterium]